jgi:MoaA/NifB/PqqE/SkfB family radical SAM enzyme
VSCNCQDYDARSVIGDLSRDTLEAVFAGPRASWFRRRLADGRFPIDTCLGCSELRRAPRAEAERHVAEFAIPKRGIMVENTVLCNLSCGSCVRKVLMQTRSQKTLELEDIRKISDLLQRQGIETLYYFKFGEPFLSPRIDEELRLIRSANPGLKIVISTNGGPLDSDRKRDAALVADHIFFSIDGPDTATLRKYQGGGNFETAYGNMKDLAMYRASRRSVRPLIEWKYVLFNWNDRRGMIRRAVELAREAGADAISFWPTRRPRRGISWRFYLFPHFKKLGVANWKGREVRLKNS